MSSLQIIIQYIYNNKNNNQLNDVERNFAMKKTPLRNWPCVAFAFAENLVNTNIVGRGIVHRQVTLLSLVTISSYSLWDTDDLF